MSKDMGVAASPSGHSGFAPSPDGLGHSASVPNADQARGAWNPRPHPDLTNFGRRAYHAGYSDGFYGYPFGAGDDGSIGGWSDYRPGYSDGRADSNADTRVIGPAAMLARDAE